MKTKTLLSILAFGLFLSSFGQKPTMELTFTAENNGQYVPLDSILIENLTQGGDTTLYAPDTILVLDYVTSIGDNGAIGENSFSVSQNYPNPFKGKTKVSLYLPEKEHIKITVRDILGRELAKYKNTLNRGNHSFIFYSGNEKYYLFTVTGKQTSKTIKMLNANGNTTFGGKCKIVYNEYEANDIGFKSQKAINNFVFTLGDELRYTGYAKTINQVNGSGVIEDTPLTNTTYEFDIFEGIPCPGIPTITYEGQVYNTVLIGAQCWLKENLNVGTMIPGTQEMVDNDTIEKYCYNDEEDSCDVYGGLYQWDEMMQYVTTEGTQGICPTGWHLPTDAEWCTLEQEVDTTITCSSTGWRGVDGGGKLKEAGTTHWISPNTGATNSSGFTGLPGGERSPDGTFGSIAGYAKFWSSSENAGNAWERTGLIVH
jgi:uncharacterized protein (TIGR02145 family)